MEVDKRTIKALAADTRIDILKSLQKRRKMPSELAREFNLAPSTITEHLKILESIRLVERKHTGHKWIYYQLTERGSGVLSPRYPVNIILTLGIGLMFLAGGLSYYLIDSPTFGAGYSAMSKEVVESSDIAPVAAAPASINKIERVEIGKPIIYLAISLIGIIMLIIGAVLFFRRNSIINVPIR